MDCSLPVSSVHGILQARILEWVAIPFFRGSSRPRNRTQFCIAVRVFTVYPYVQEKIRSNAQKSVRKSTTSPWSWGVICVFFVKAAWWYLLLSLKRSIPFGPTNMFIFIYSEKYTNVNESGARVLIMVLLITVKIQI